MYDGDACGGYQKALHLAEHEDCNYAYCWKIATVP